MSDYIPNPPNPERDPNDYRRHLNTGSDGRGLTLIVGILVAIALATGLMFFAGTPGDRVEQAQAPRERTAPATRAPATPAIPPARPAAPANPQE